MSDYYDRLLLNNNVVPYRVHGYAADHWVNHAIVMNTQWIHQYVISVYANTPHEARFYADRLKTYIEQNPMVNEYTNYPDDISFGVKQAVLDTMSQAYKVDMVMMTGALIM